MAKIDAIEATLKDGREVVLRSPTPDEAGPLLAYTRLIFDDDVGNVSSPDELTFTVDEQRAWIEALLNHPDDLVVIADAGGEIVGLINFRAVRLKRLAHNGSLGMSVHPQWRDRGLGRALLSRLLDWARANPRIRRVGLQVIADNARAIALYRKLGFVEEGRRPEYVDYGDRRVDDILMCFRV